MNEFPLSVCLAPNVGLPESDLERFPVGILSGHVLHTAERGN